MEMAERELEHFQFFQVLYRNLCFRGSRIQINWKIFLLRMKGSVMMGRWEGGMILKNLNFAIFQSYISMTIFLRVYLEYKFGYIFLLGMKG